MDSLIYSLNATVPIFAVIFLSYLLKQRGFFKESFISGADKVIFQLFLPVLLFRDIAEGRITETFDLTFFLFCMISTVIYVFAIWGGAELFMKDKTMIGAFTQGAFRGSLAVLGVAFIQNIYGDAGLAPLMIVATVPLYNIFAVIVLTVRSNEPVAGGDSMIRATLKGILRNPIILGIIAGLPFSLLEIEFPTMINKTLDMIAAPATPLALVTIGAGFEGAKAIKKIKPTGIASVIKLVILPAIFLPIAVFMGFRNQALVSILIMTGAPSTVSGYIMAKNMNADYVLSSSIIVLTTAVSIFTMTLALYIMRSLALI